MTCVADFHTHPVSVIAVDSVFWRKSYDSVLIALLPGDGPVSALDATRSWIGGVLRAMQIKGIGRKVKFVFGAKPTPLCVSFLGIDDISTAIENDILEHSLRSYVADYDPVRPVDHVNGHDGMRWAVRHIQPAPRIAPDPTSEWCEPDMLGEGALPAQDDEVDDDFGEEWRARALWTFLRSDGGGGGDDSAETADIWAQAFSATYRRTFRDVLLAIMSILVAVNSVIWPYYAYIHCWNDVHAGLYSVATIYARSVCQAYVQRVRFKATVVEAPTEAAADPMLVAYSSDGASVHRDCVQDPGRYTVPAHAWPLYRCVSRVEIDVVDQDWYATWILVSTQVNAFGVLFIIAMWRNMAAVVFALAALLNFTIGVAWNHRNVKNRLAQTERDRKFNAALQAGNRAFAEKRAGRGPDAWSADPQRPRYAEWIRYLNREQPAPSVAVDVRKTVPTSAPNPLVLSATDSRTPLLRRSTAV